MDPQRVRRAAELFDQAVDLPAGERTRFLNAACPDDAALRAEVRAIFDHDRSAGRFMNGPRESRTSVRAAPADLAPGLPEEIGDFRVVRKIGEGGMGAVYEALQGSLGRPVALKVLKAGAVTAGALRRFEYEAQLLARLRHPGIAQIHQAGVFQTPAGPLPYFAMECIDGALPITDFAASNALTTRRRLELFAAVCDAVHHGHQKGVIHRDLKPSNILVDAAGHSRVIDFGVACCVDPDAALGTMQTSVGQLVGTVHYMSPEQCAGNSADVDTRSDVYSLGVVLFELLTGRSPYDPRDSGLFEKMRAVRESPPPRLSSIDRRLGGDLETIARKALEKDRGLRYQSAAEFGADIRRLLRNEPVEARPPTLTYQLRVFARRQRALVGGVAAVFIVLVGGIIATTRQTLHANRARAEAEQRRIEAERGAYSASLFAAAASINASDGGAAMQRLRQAPAALRNWEWGYLARCADQSALKFQGASGLRVYQVEFSPGGRFLAAGLTGDGAPSRLQVWECASGNLALDLTGETGVAMCFCLLPGERLALRTADHHLVLMDLISGSQVSRTRMAPGWDSLGPLGMTPSQMMMGWVSDGDVIRVVSWNADNGVSGFETRLPVGVWIGGSRLSNDGRRGAVGLTNGDVLVFDTSGEFKPARIAALSGRVMGLAFSADNRLLAASGEGGVIKAYELSTSGDREERGDSPAIAARPIATMGGFSQRVTSLQFSPDSALLIAGSADKAARIWRIADQRLVSTLLGDEAIITAVAFSPDGRRVATGSYSSVVRIWDPSRPAVVQSRHDLQGPVSALAFSGDGRRLLVHSSGAYPILVDPATLATTVTFDSAANAADSAVLARHGERVILNCFDRSIRTIDIDTRRERSRIDTDTEGSSPMALNPDDSLLAWGSDCVHLWDMHPGSSPQKLGPPGAKIAALDFSPDGRRIVSGDAGGLLTTWELATRRPASVQGRTAGVLAVDHSPDGRLMAAAFEDGAIELRETGTAALVNTLYPGIGDVWRVAFSPDGTRLAAGGRDCSVRLFDTATGSEVLALRGPTGTIMSLAISPDGRRIAAGSWARELFVWDAGPDESAAPPPTGVAGISSTGGSEPAADSAPATQRPALR